jgi:transposase
MKKAKVIELSQEEAQRLLRNLKDKVSEDDYKLLEGLINTIDVLSSALKEKKISISRLRSLFGIKTEKSSRVLRDIEKQIKDNGPGAEGSELIDEREDKKDEGATSEIEDKMGKEKKGHGRNGSVSFTGMEKIFISHTELKAGDLCPGCHKGKIYDTKRPGVIVSIRGSAPINGTVYELQKLRCALCGELFTAESPENIKNNKYDDAAASMIALLKYGCGFPFYRLERLQESLRIPMPASTQWEIVENFANISAENIHTRLIETAAQGHIMHNDDTGAKILNMIPANEEEDEDSPDKSSRKGIFTTGIVSITDDTRIALYYTGRNHAGENITELLKKRYEGKDPPIQMCDALSRNIPKEFETILCNCLTHGRRQFTDIIEYFPDECRHVITIIKDVYYFDKISKEMKMTPEERLLYHQKNSGPLMEDLRQWIYKQFDEKNAEPNSSLGTAYKYLLKHWQALTAFLRVPGAPLDNNIVEQILKRAILHRKNSYFFKTENGARVGDIFMSIIETCNLNKVNPFDYLQAIKKYSIEVKKDAVKWMPWNYKHALKALPTKK